MSDGRRWLRYGVVWVGIVTALVAWVYWRLSPAAVPLLLNAIGIGLRYAPGVFGTAPLSRRNRTVLMYLCITFGWLWMVVFGVQLARIASQLD